MNVIEKFLAPISPEQPCGQDIWYSPEFLELDQLIQGKAETQFSEAVKPDWKLVFARCEEMMTMSKHLQVATVYVLASLQTKGLRAAADALTLLSQWLMHYWADLYPNLDPADHWDPLERMNILYALSSPVGTFGDSFRFIERLGEAPLTNSPQLGKLSYAEIRHAVEGSASAAGLDRTQIAAAFRDTPQEELQTELLAIRDAKEAIEGISSFLNALPEADNVPSFDPLTQQLLAMEKAILPFMEGDPVAEASLVAGTPVAAARVSTAPSAVQSRNDVVATLERVCAYYAEFEPSSPIPLLLKRAKKLVFLDFLEIMKDLAPDTAGQLRFLTGETPK